MTARSLSRREWFGLGAAALGALGLNHYLRNERALGTDVSEFIDVPGMLNAPGFPVEGRADARITLLVFSDYACGICREVEPYWREAVREAGDVRVVHRDWPILGPQSRRAARLALAAVRQELYVPAHDALMRSPGLGEPALRAALGAAGADWRRLQADLATHAAEIDGLLDRTARDALRLGFAGTPGFLIGPIRINGRASARQFAAAIERARDQIGAGRLS